MVEVISFTDLPKEGRKINVAERCFDSVMQRYDTLSMHTDWRKHVKKEFGRKEIKGQQIRGGGGGPLAVPTIRRTHSSASFVEATWWIPRDAEPINDLPLLAPLHQYDTVGHERIDDKTRDWTFAIEALYLLRTWIVASKFLRSFETFQYRGNTHKESRIHTIVTSNKCIVVWQETCYENYSLRICFLNEQKIWIIKSRCSDDFLPLQDNDSTNNVSFLFDFLEVAAKS